MQMACLGILKVVYLQRLSWDELALPQSKLDPCDTSSGSLSGSEVTPGYRLNLSFPLGTLKWGWNNAESGVHIALAPKRAVHDERKIGMEGTGLVLGR